LAQKNAFVYALTKNTDSLKPLLEKFPKNIKGIQCNLRDWKETEKVIGELEPLDHLVNNAGVAHREDFFDISQEHFDE
jgi:NADP-dependent 3-hydroxy acid dehydrogenase YdfG